MEEKFRIKKNIEFKRLYKKSKRFYNRDFIILKSENGLDYPRFGFTITKKFGKANVRNGIRRKLKEIVRLNMVDFENMDYVITPKYHLTEYDYHQLENSLKHVLSISKRIR